MLDLGLWEMVLIAVVAILVLKPEDAPEVMRMIGKGIRKMKQFMRELTDITSSVLDEEDTPPRKSRHDYTMKDITDLDGNTQAAYDVKEIEEFYPPPGTPELEEKDKTPEA